MKFDEIGDVSFNKMNTIIRQLQESTESVALSEIIEKAEDVGIPADKVRLPPTLAQSLRVNSDLILFLHFHRQNKFYCQCTN